MTERLLEIAALEHVDHPRQVPGVCALEEAREARQHEQARGGIEDPRAQTIEEPRPRGRLRERGERARRAAALRGWRGRVARAGAEDGEDRREELRHAAERKERVAHDTSRGRAEHGAASRPRRRRRASPAELRERLEHRRDLGGRDRRAQRLAHVERRRHRRDGRRERRRAERDRFHDDELRDVEPERRVLLLLGARRVRRGEPRAHQNDGIGRGGEVGALGVRERRRREDVPLPDQRRARRRVDARPHRLGEKKRDAARHATNHRARLIPGQDPCPRLRLCERRAEPEAARENVPGVDDATDLHGSPERRRAMGPARPTVREWMKTSPCSVRKASSLAPALTTTSTMGAALVAIGSIASAR